MLDSSPCALVGKIDSNRWVRRPTASRTLYRLASDHQDAQDQLAVPGQSRSRCHSSPWIDMLQAASATCQDTRKPKRRKFRCRQASAAGLRQKQQLGFAFGDCLLSLPELHKTAHVTLASTAWTYKPNVQPRSMPSPWPREYFGDHKCGSGSHRNLTSKSLGSEKYLRKAQNHYTYCIACCAMSTRWA